ncbi:MAG: hypothetical protein V4538_12125 [Bacteroidota bacterium]
MQGSCYGKGLFMVGAPLQNYSRELVPIDWAKQSIGCIKQLALLIDV